MMSKNISNEILKRLQSSFLWNKDTKNTGKYINCLTCPACGKPEAFTYTDNPFNIFCHRQSKCNATTNIKNLFPDLFNIEEYCKPTEEDPNYPATYYLSIRGINKALKGLVYEYWPDIRKTGCGGVVFPLPSRNGYVVYNGRIFNPKEGVQKSHNQGATAGLYWIHPGITYDFNHEVFITEGIIDALSLIELGHQAIAILASGQDPARVILPTLRSPVFAFDNDPAGHRAVKKWLGMYKDAKAIMPPAGTDWNDFLLGKQRGHFNELRKRLEWYAKLATAETAMDYASKYYEFDAKLPGLFEFNGCYWWPSIKDSDDSIEPRVEYISNFTVAVDHYQLDNSNPDEPSNRYYLRVKPKAGRPSACSATAGDLFTPHVTKRFFLDRARVHWEAHAKASEALIKMITETKAPIVRQLYITGYDEQSRNYYIGDMMIAENGKTKMVDKTGYFAISANDYVRPAHNPAIKPSFDFDKCREIYQNIYDVWGDNGLAATAWTTASWFVRQIKSRLGFFPVLSLHGDTQTGKTTLARVLNAMQCLDEEGLPMRATNTSKGEIRKLAQRSGMFTAMLEWPASGKARFDLDSVLTMYNEAPLQVRALKSNNLETKELSFLGALMFVQNREPFTTRAQKERVISLRFKTDHVTPETGGHLNRLNKNAFGDLASFFPFVLSHRTEIEARWQEIYGKAQAMLDQSAIDARVRDNHALILTFNSFLGKITGFKPDFADFVRKLAVAKHKASCVVFETMADLFLDMVIQVQEDKEISNISVNFIDFNEGDMTVWIHAAGALKAVKDAGFININPRDLYKELVDHPAYLLNNHPHRFNDGVHKAWKFDATKLRGNEECL